MAGASGVVSFGLPAGLSPDIDKLVDYALVGSANLYASSTQGGSSHWVGASEVNHNTSRIQVVFDSTGGLSAVLSDGFPFNLGTGGVTHFNVSIPVRGWTLSAP